MARLGFELIAPVGSTGRPAPWEGRAARKPWEHRVTVAIPHLDTPEPLPEVIELLRLQYEKPYILIVDTGSSPASRAILETFRDEDLEIHYVFGHAYRHASEPVCVALDLAHALCRSEYLFHTHADVFARRRDLLGWMLAQCNEACPVVGYQLSERSWVTQEWQGMVSHTATMLHMPTIAWKHGISWSYQRVHYGYGYPWVMGAGWPDTETGFNRGLRTAGIKPRLIGNDVNYQRQVDDNIDHVRSYSGSKLYGQAYFTQKAVSWMDTARADARHRIATWKSGGS